VPSASRRRRNSPRPDDICSTSSFATDSPERFARRTPIVSARIRVGVDPLATNWSDEPAAFQVRIARRDLHPGRRTDPSGLGRRDGPILVAPNGEEPVETDASISRVHGRAIETLDRAGAAAIENGQEESGLKDITSA
jgi:hypothetical protein